VYEELFLLHGVINIIITRVYENRRDKKEEKFVTIRRAFGYSVFHRESMDFYLGFYDIISISMYNLNKSP